MAETKLIEATDPPFQHDPDQFTSSTDDFLILKPATWFIQLIVVQIDFISDCFFALVSIYLTFKSMLSEAFLRAGEATKSTEETVNREIAAVSEMPFKVAEGIGLLLKKLGFGFLGATYVCLVLVLILVFASFLGVGLVKWWVEEPIFMREPLYFDYTEIHPSALVSFNRLHGKTRVIPVGHTLFVSVALLMPESDFNRQIGMFQVYAKPTETTFRCYIQDCEISIRIIGKKLSADVISSSGNTLARSSQPSMLRFRSFPIRLMRTFIMGAPLLMGMAIEAQQLSVQILKYRETNLRTEAIRVTLKPRAGTSGLPELYTVELLVNSQLPWSKELVRNWKWTFYVWVSLYVYIMLLIILFSCCKPFVFPASVGGQSRRERVTEEEVKRGDGEFSDTVRRLHQGRGNRRRWERHRVSPESVQCSTSSTVTAEETGGSS